MPAGILFAVEPKPVPPASTLPSPPYLSPAESQQLFQVPPGYHVELVLSEPEISDPVLTVFDGNGRMYVAEMRSYMRDVDGSGQKAPISRISLHWSSKGDNVFDRHSVFIDGLVLPRLILPLDDSILVQETDSGDIYEYRDTDGDGVADEKKLFFAGEARKDNIQHQTSGLIWSLDNWLYATYRTTRLRWTPQGAIKEPCPPDGGQWGLTQDDDGKPWLVNAGSEIGPLNFQQPIIYGGFRIKDELAPGFSEVWPLVSLPDMQGGPDRFRPVEKTLNHFTATCGADIYRGDRLPRDLEGDLLFCEPVGRLIRRAKIEVRDGVTRLANAYERAEFIRSADPYFRPVNLVTAPDGTLYITDMDRGIVEEAEWTPRGSYIRGIIQQYGLEKNHGRGRIWRLVYDGMQPGPPPHLRDETPAQLVRELAHPNGWWRDTAQKLLVLRQDRSVVPALQAMARLDPNPLARIHALWTIEGLGTLDAGLIREKLQDPSIRVRVAAIRVSETLFKRSDDTLKNEILARFNDPDPGIAIQAMMSATLLHWPEAIPLIQKDAVASPSQGIREIGAQLLNPLSARVPAGYYGEERARIERGQAIYMGLCFACHGLDGKGAPREGRNLTLAPPLAGSQTVRAHRDALINILLFGATGPVALTDYEAPMVALGANDDEWIAAVASYVRSGFGNHASLVTAADVRRVRTAEANRQKPWTLAELYPRLPRPLANSARWSFTSNRSTGTASDAAGPVTLSFTAGPTQKPGAWLKIELPEAALLSDLRMDCSQTPRNFARGYRIELSLDGTNWGEPVASGKGAGPVLEVSFSPTRARWIRITQTGSVDDRAWTVDEVTLFTPPTTAAAKP